MNCNVKIFSFVANFFAVLTGVAAGLLLFFAVITAGAAELFAFIALAIAAVIALILLVFVLFRCLRSCREAQQVICSYAGILTAGAVGTVILAIISLIVGLVPATVAIAVLFGLLVLFFAVTIANVLTVGYGVYRATFPDCDGTCQRR